MEVTPKLNITDGLVITLMEKLTEAASGPYDNPEHVLEILTTYGFHDLSEDMKHYCLTAKHSDRVYPLPDPSIWHRLVSKGKVNSMEVLFPHTPLFAVTENYIPLQYQWIESRAWG